MQVLVSCTSRSSTLLHHSLIIIYETLVKRWPTIPNVIDSMYSNNHEPTYFLDKTCHLPILRHVVIRSSQSGFSEACWSRRAWSEYMTHGHVALRRVGRIGVAGHRTYIPIDDRDKGIMVRHDMAPLNGIMTRWPVRHGRLMHLRMSHRLATGTA
jgi:hypothetical protein